MSEVHVAEPEVRPFYTVKSLAARLSVSERTIWNWMDSGKLPYYDLGDLRRIDPADVDSLLKASRAERRAA